MYNSQLKATVAKEVTNEFRWMEYLLIVHNSFLTLALCLVMFFCCLSLSFPNCFQVAEKAHFLWNNDEILNLIMHNRQVILPLVFPALHRNTQNHWNQAVLNLTQNVRKMFYEIDEELMLACQGKFEEEDSKSIVVAERRRLTWERLETAAAFQPVACAVTC